MENLIEGIFAMINHKVEYYDANQIVNRSV